MKYLTKMFITALFVVICSYVMPGIHVDGLFTAFVLAILLSFLNMFIKPLLIILTIPITLLTLGLFLLFINAILIFIAAALIDGFRVDNIWWALGFGIVLSFVNSFANAVVDKK
jgi:putative membrane protein